MKIILDAICGLALFLASNLACSAALPGIPEFIDEMVSRHHFNRAELVSVFEHAQHRPLVIEAISRPSTIKPWLLYRQAFVNRKRIQLGLLFWNKYRPTLRRAEKVYGVPQEIIVAVIGVETIYGKSMGNFRVLDALTTLAFDYPARSVFFREELENFLLLAQEQQFDLLSLRGSYAGALGIPQFMPSSYRKYAVDFNGNHKIDLLREDRDAIGSVANYLHNFGWLSNEPVAQIAKNGIEPLPGEARKFRTMTDWAVLGVTPVKATAPEKTARLVDFTVEQGKEFWLAFNNFDVITRYNNSDFYAMTVFQLAQELKAAGPVKSLATVSAKKSDRAVIAKVK